jgi:O-antigen/teichoic acid export membrane protein
VTGANVLPRSKQTFAIVAMTLASLFARLSSLAGQVVVGFYLTEAQVGTYAIAVGVLGVTALMRGGGAALYLPTIKPEEFEAKASRQFWWCTGFLTFSALLTTAVIALIPVVQGSEWLHAVLPSLARASDLPGLEATLWVMAARQVIGGPLTVGRMRMSVELRFKELAKLDTMLALLRLALTWVIASSGLGALALALPHLAMGVVELLYYFVSDACKLSDLRWNGRGFREIAAKMKWPLVAAIANSINGQVNLLVLGILVPASTVGVFYFAFQLASQPTVFLGAALQNVLAPFLARDRGNPVLERLGMERVFAAGMLFVPITTVATASFFPSLERLLWGGRWAAANFGIMFLCVGATYATVATILTGPLLGLRQFKAVAAFEAGKIVGTVGGAALGALLLWRREALLPHWVSEETIVCATTGLMMTIASLGQLVWIMRKYSTEWNTLVRMLAFGPLLATLTAVAAQSIGHSLVNTLALPSGRSGAAVELGTVCSVYGVLIIMAIRFTAEGTLRDTVSVLPAKIRDRLNGVLGLH